MQTFESVAKVTLLTTVSPCYQGATTDIPFPGRQTQCRHGVTEKELGNPSTKSLLHSWRYKCFAGV